MSDKPSNRRNISRARKLFGVLVSFAVFQYGCAVTGPVVTRQEEAAARNQLQLADYRIWWDHQKWLLQVSDRFAWGINTPGASYRNAMGKIGRASCRERG